LGKVRLEGVKMCNERDMVTGKMWSGDDREGRRVWGLVNEEEGGFIKDRERGADVTRRVQ
jgi:hypothetical protein